MATFRYLEGMQPPEGPPVWTALKALPFGIPPPMSKTSSPRVVPMGTSTRPVLVTFPERAKTLVPLLVGVPMELNHSHPLRKIWRMLARVSTLLMIVGFCQRPLLAGKGGLGRGCPRDALDRGDQGRFLAADKGPGAHAHFHVEIKARFEDPFSQEAHLPGLLDGDVQAVDGQGVFGAHINISPVGADGISGNGHSFQNGMGVSFANRPVHKRPGVALVGVADDVFLVGRVLPGEFPFHAGGKSRSPPALQPGLGDDLDHLLRGFIEVRMVPRASYPRWVMYSSIFSGSIRPQLARTIFSCFSKKGICFFSSTILRASGASQRRGAHRAAL